MPVRVRFAPSPTGFLHVGGARTALFNWLWARHNDGTMILRIEDTDLQRSTAESVDQILESLRWLGIDWDDGPFFQSQRGDVYRAALQRLIADGKAYRAFETPEELEAMRQKAMAEGRHIVYDRRSLHLGAEQVRAHLAEGRPFVWRFKCPPGETVIPETLLGGEECRFDNETIGDFPLTRAGTESEWGGPLYNFCCAVDDADMRITHVIRGQEHLSNAARQVLILQALGAPVPTYTHLPLVMKNNKKMSKRDADADPRFPVSVSARRDLGYLPEATINFIALLGWSLDDKTEFFSVPDLIAQFGLEGLSKSNANFDEDKYLHMNAWYLRNLPRAEVVERVKPWLAEEGLEAGARGQQWLEFLIGLVVERCRLLAEFPEALEYFFRPPAFYEARGVEKLFAGEGVAEQLRETAQAVEQAADFSHDGLEAALRQFAEQRGLGFGKVAQPVRLALTGRMASPGLFDVMVGLGREETVSRLRQAADLIEAGTVPKA